jgi:signal transduction histidine kinase
MDAPDRLRSDLRKLVLEDPRAARRLFIAELENDASSLGVFLDQLSSPSDTRLRHMVANAIRIHPRKDRVVRHLLTWRDSESDEFTRRAIDAALSGVDEQSVSGRSKAKIDRIPHIVEAYGYVSQRLKHRIRNGLLPARAHVSRLAMELNSHASPAVQEALSKLSASMTSLARVVGAIDADPRYFEFRSVGLADWLKQMNGDYAARYSAITLTLQGHDLASARVLASDYLLETLFWNLWVNAHQEIEVNCEIGIQIGVQGKNVELTIADNGGGFPKEMCGVAFTDRFSGKEHYRGTGLLEVQDAVVRLQGRIELCECEGKYRIKLSLPLHCL